MLKLASLLLATCLAVSVSPVSAGMEWLLNRHRMYVVLTISVHGNVATRYSDPRGSANLLNTVSQRSEEVHAPREAYSVSTRTRCKVS